MAQGRSIHSVFIGGTPSLISAQNTHGSYLPSSGLVWTSSLIVKSLWKPTQGTVEHDPFADYLAAGINRLSIVCKSFDPEHLQRLGPVVFMPIMRSVPFQQRVRQAFSVSMWI